MSELRNPYAERWDLDRALRESGIPTPFPRGITFADVDAETEVNGYFLVIEGKRMQEELSRGQGYTMNARARDGRTCIVIYGEPPCDVREFRLWGCPRAPITLRGLRDLIASWVDWAEAQPRPIPRRNDFIELAMQRVLVAA